MWNVSFKRKLNRALSPAHLIVEFDKNKINRIFSHTLGQINFNSKLDLNLTRDQTIEVQKENKDINGYLYKAIGHTYQDIREVEESEDGGYEILAHGSAVGGTNHAGLENCHIERMICKSGEGTNKYCNPGKCIIGKLYKESKIKWKYESISQFSLNSNKAFSEKVTYFVGGEEVLALKNIIRGEYQNAPVPKTTWGQANLDWGYIDQVRDIDVFNVNTEYSDFSYETSNKLDIDGSASKYTLFYIPPKFYYDKDFISMSIFRLDRDSKVVGVYDSIEVFTRKILLAAYPNQSEGVINNKAENYPEEIVKNVLIDSFFDVKEIWREEIIKIIEREWTNRYNNIYDTNKYIRVVAEKIKDLFNKGLQITKSSISKSKLVNNVSLKERPVYFRLPGSMEGYRKVERDDLIFVQNIEDRLQLDVNILEIGTIVTTVRRDIAYRFLPRKIESSIERKRFGMSPIISDRTKEELYSSADVLSWTLYPLDSLPEADVAKFLVSGVDEFLIDKKNSIDNFYRDFLDPDTCNPDLLNWLAQHIGLFGELWNELWDKDLKSAMIKNAFGWFDRNSTVSLPNNKVILTEKGKNLTKAPFDNDKIWTENEAEVNNILIDFSKIETIITDLNNVKSILGENKYTLKEYDEVNKKIQESYSETVLFSKELWNGLFEAKGNILVIAFLSSLMGLKAPSAKELEILNIGVSDGDFVNKVLRPRSGLRDVEQSAPPLLPYKPEVIQAGDETDAQVNNFPNQLVAGISRVSSTEESKNVVFRVPYYYNKDGKSWDRVNYIAKNWLPNNLNTRIQYPHLSANLWAVGDLFFEPEILVNSIYESPLITSEDREFYLTTEKGNSLNYNYEVDESIYETPLILTELNQFTVTENEIPLNYST